MHEQYLSSQPGEMAENADTALVKLKRKIIAVDKLVKHKSKTDASIAALSSQVGERDKVIEERENEIAKLKAELLESLVSSGDGSVSSEEVEDLKRKVEEMQKLLDSKSHQVSSLQGETSSKSKKVEHLESELVKIKGKFAALEKSLKSKNEDIIKRELESQSLKQQIEDLQREKKSLETSISTGQHIDDVKRTYEESKWKNLAEISKLKQESGFFEKQVKELEEANKALHKTNAELQKHTDQQKNQSKLNDSLEKSLEKRDKSILSLEKKLAQALQENEKLKLRMKNKTIEIPATATQPLTKLFEDAGAANEDELEEDDEESDCEIVTLYPEPEPEADNSFMQFRSFSFSNPGARFQILRPKPPTKKKFNFIFEKKASTVDIIPNVFNVAPKISDHFLKLSRPKKEIREKRKHRDESYSASGVKRLKPDEPNISNIYLSETLPSNLLNASLASPTPVKQSTKKKRKQSSSSDQESPASIAKSVKQSSCSSFQPSLNSTAMIPDPGDKFTEPNPVRARRAHTKASIQAALSAVPKFEPSKKKEEKLPSLQFSLPPQLSPIKSPRVSGNKTSSISKSKAKASSAKVNPPSVNSTAFPENSSASTVTSTVTSTTSAASARERIKAASLAPVTVEAPVKSVGGKLNPTQLEAARRRAVPCSATTLAPSVDGFRQSSKTGKGDARVRKDRKVSEELTYCPSRKRTNPARMTNSSESKIESVSVKTETVAVVKNPDKVKSKEFISTEEDTEDEIDAKLKAGDENIKTSGAETKAAVKVENIHETLDGDLTMSDSEEEDEKPDPEKMMTPDDEFFESGDDEERKGRFSKLKSERWQQEDEISVPDSDSKPVAEVRDTSRPDQPKIFQTLLEETIHSFKVRIFSFYMEMM